MTQKRIICILAPCCLLGGCGAAQKAPTGSLPSREEQQLTVWSAYRDCQESVTVMERCAEKSHLHLAGELSDGAVSLKICFVK